LRTATSACSTGGSPTRSPAPGCREDGLEEDEASLSDVRVHERERRGQWHPAGKSLEGLSIRIRFAQVWQGDRSDDTIQDFRVTNRDF